MIIILNQSEIAKAIRNYLSGYYSIKDTDEVLVQPHIHRINESPNALIHPGNANITISATCEIKK